MWEVNTDFDYKLYTSPGGGNDNSFQYSCWKNPMNKGACRATVHGVAKSWMWQRDGTHMLSPLLLSQSSIWTSLVAVVLVAQSCSALCTPWTVACRAPLSMGFSRQEHWSGFPCPSAEDHADPGIKPTSLVSPALVGRFFTTGPPARP